MTKEELLSGHPDLVAAITAEAREGLITPETLQQHLETAKAEGAEAERQRIADVRAQSLPGHEALIEQMAADGTSTGNDAAKAIVAAEKTSRNQADANIDADAPPVVPPADDAQGSSKKMSKSAFKQLDVSAQGAFIRAGGQVVE